MTRSKTNRKKKKKMEELQAQLEAEKKARAELEERLASREDALLTKLVAALDVKKAQPAGNLYVSHGRKVPIFREAPKSSSEISISEWSTDVQ